MEIKLEHCINMWEPQIVLTEECLEFPPATAANTAREKFDNWILSNNKAKCYMVASMSDVLRKKFENTENAYEI